MNQLKPIVAARTTYTNPYQFQPVTLINGVASIARGAIAMILAIALLRIHARNRQLLSRLASRDG